MVNFEPILRIYSVHQKVYTFAVSFSKPTLSGDQSNDRLPPTKVGLELRGKGCLLHILQCVFTASEGCFGALRHIFRCCSVWAFWCSVKGRLVISALLGPGLQCPVRLSSGSFGAFSLV